MELCECVSISDGDCVFTAPFFGASMRNVMYQPDAANSMDLFKVRVNDWDFR